MKYRVVPQTDIQVSEVGFGVWTVSSPWWGVTDEDFGIRLMHTAFDLGINFFETADNYGNGKGETIVANAFRGRRDKIVISTKFGYDFYHNERKGQQELPQDFRPEYIRFSLEETLRRLETDYVDFYSMHNPRVDSIRRDDTFATLRELKAEGKIRHFGVALGPAINERQIEEGVVAITEKKVALVQLIYNLFERMIGEGVFPTARKEGGGILVRVPHASGLLDGTVKADTTFSEKDHRYFRVKDPEARRKWQDEGLKKVDKLGFLLEGGRTLGQVALQALLLEPSIVSVLPNIYQEEQLREFAGTSDMSPITSDEQQKLRDLLIHDFYLTPVSV